MATRHQPCRSEVNIWPHSERRDDLLHSVFRKEIVVLQRYFIKPTTIDRIRACWIGDAIERYVAWLTEQNYAARNVFGRVPILVRFGEFTKARGLGNWNELPAQVEPFVDHWLREHGQ